MQRYIAIVGQAEHEVSVELLDEGRRRVRIKRADGSESEHVVDARALDGTTQSLLCDGAVYTVDVLAAAGPAGSVTVDAGFGPVPMRIVDAHRRALEAGKATSGHKHTGPLPVRAPMPGKVVKVLVKEGEAVQAQQPLLIIEAMKMENELRAPRAGSVGALKARDGQAVEAGEPLLELT